MSDPLSHASPGFQADNCGNSVFELPSQARYPVQGLEYYDRGRTGRPFYGGLGVGLLVEGDLDLDRVEKAVQHLYDDIDTTRVMYPASPNHPLQYRIREHVDFELKVHTIDEGSLDARIAEASAREYSSLSILKTYDDIAMHAAVYDLGTNPSGKRAWIIALSVNHIVIDDQGILMILNQFMVNYRGEDCKAVHQVGLMDYLNFMNDNPDYVDAEANRAYWSREMAGYETPSLHESDPDLETPLDPAEFAFHLDTEPLRELALACQTTLPSLFMAALHVGTAAGFNVRDSAICMLTEARPNFIFWNTVVHGLLFMNNRMQLSDDETFLEFARRTVLKMSENLQNLVSDECTGGAAHMYYTYVSPFRSPNLGDGLTCTSWTPNLIGDNAGYLPSDMVSVFESASTMELTQMIDPAISFFTPNEIRALGHGVKRSLEIAVDNPGVLVGDIITTVQAELRARGVIANA